MTLALVTPGRQFSQGYVESMVDTINYCAQHGIEVMFSGNGSANIYTARTAALAAEAEAMPPRPLAGKPYDYILMLDSDMVWRAEDIAKAIRLDRDVVVGPMFSALMVTALSA